MFVSRSEVSAFCSIHRDSCVTGANAMSASSAGSGRSPRRAADERVARRAGAWRRRVTGFHRVAGATVGVERDLARSGAPLEQRRHRPPPARGRHLALGWRHRDLRQLLRFGERRCRNRRAGDRPRAKRRRRARRCRRRARRRSVVRGGMPPRPRARPSAR